MSEADFLTFSRERAKLSGPLADEVAIGLSDENTFPRKGKLDFVDNALDRSSGTIHARATVANPDLFLAPGQFARLRVAVAPPTSVLLLPDAAVVLDQSQHLVMTVAADGTVVPKIVDTGDLRGGLRVVRSGLDAKRPRRDRRTGARHSRQQGRAAGRHDQLRRGRRRPRLTPDPFRSNRDGSNSGFSYDAFFLSGPRGHFARYAIARRRTCSYPEPSSTGRSSPPC